MPQAINQSDLLRTLGRLLDSEAIEHADLRFEGELVTVSSTPPGGDRVLRTYVLNDLIVLSQQARTSRGRSSPPAVDRLESRFRTLGQELGQTHFEVDRIHVSTGVHVHGRLNGTRSERWFSQDELMQKDRQRKGFRRLISSPASWPQRLKQKLFKQSARPAHPA
jgi:hypothetical protein